LIGGAARQSRCGLHSKRDSLGFAAGVGVHRGISFAAAGEGIPKLARGSWAWRYFGVGRLAQGSHGRTDRRVGRGGNWHCCFLCVAAKSESRGMIYQLGWTTLPGLRGLSVSEFRATPTNAPDNERGVALEFATDAERGDLLRQLEENFGPRRFTNAADAFDSVRAFVLEYAGKR
jgi:hypothetical protein